MNSLKKTARTAGFWYLLMAITDPIGLLYVPSKLIVPEDATATANNIMASESRSFRNRQIKSERAALALDAFKP
jgi:hypothetical protein